MIRLGGILWFLCALWVIYDVWSQNNRYDNSAKLLWTIAALLLAVPTAIVYFLIGRGRRF